MKKASDELLRMQLKEQHKDFRAEKLRDYLITND